jgi:hypothetical protein
MEEFKLLKIKQDLLTSARDEYQDQVELYGDGSFLELPYGAQVLRRNVMHLNKEVRNICHDLGIVRGWDVEYDEAEYTAAE